MESWNHGKADDWKIYFYYIYYEYYVYLFYNLFVFIFAEKFLIWLKIILMKLLILIGF